MFGFQPPVAQRSLNFAPRRKRQLAALAAICSALLATNALAQTGPDLILPPSEPWSPPAAASEAAPAATEATTSAEGELPAPDAAAAESAAEATAVSPEDDIISEEETMRWYEPHYWIRPMAWETGLELGLNGSSGTSESFSIRAGGYLKRESRFSKIDLSAYHNRTSTGGENTQNNATFDARNDWMLDDTSPWTLFATTNVFYDEFQTFDVQTNINSGIGYRFVRDPDLDLIGRVGIGTSREFGGPDDRWVPESLFGIEYSQRFWKTQKLYSKVDYFPDWDQVGEFRLVADAGWEIQLAEPSNLSLKLSANDRYDSTPNGAEPHLVNYSVLLLLKL